MQYASRQQPLNINSVKLLRLQTHYLVVCEFSNDLSGLQVAVHVRASRGSPNSAHFTVLPLQSPSPRESHGGARIFTTQPLLPRHKQQPGFNTQSLCLKALTLLTKYIFSREEYCLWQHDPSRRIGRQCQRINHDSANQNSPHCAVAITYTVLSSYLRRKHVEPQLLGR